MKFTWNRERRRAFEKAARVIKRGTVVPTGVRAKVPHEALQVFAAKHDKVIDRAGRVFNFTPATAYLAPAPETAALA